MVSWSGTHRTQAIPYVLCSGNRDRRPIRLNLFRNSIYERAVHNMPRDAPFRRRAKGYAWNQPCAPLQKGVRSRKCHAFFSFETFVRIHTSEERVDASVPAWLHWETAATEAHLLVLPFVPFSLETTLTHTHCCCCFALNHSFMRLFTYRSRVVVGPSAAVVAFSAKVDCAGA